MRRGQQGIALITAVLIVALAAIAASAIMVSANLAMHRTQNLQESEIAWWYADGVEAWGKTILARDAEANRIDALNDIWATPVDFLPIDEGALRGGISDLQGRYNLNNLGVRQPDKFQQELQIFVRLVQLASGVDEYQARRIGSAIRDYVDADSTPTGIDGAEDSDYLGLDIPRRVPNRRMQSVSELLAVQGVTAEIYAKLLPHVCALPADNVQVNVNTATPLLLMALGNLQTPSDKLKQFLEERLGDPAKLTDELFNARGVFDTSAVPQSAMSTGSAYFELRVEVFVGSGRLALYSFYHRAGNAAPTVYARSTFTE